MSQEAGKLRPEAEWHRLDPQSILDVLEISRRATALERMDDPQLERLGAIDAALEDLTRVVVFCASCLLAIAVLLAIIAVRM